MTSLVESENERRSQERSSLLLPAELITTHGTQSIYLMEIGRQSAQSVITRTDQIPDRVSLRLSIPNSGPIEIDARVIWSKELAHQKWHVTFNEFEFKEPTQERTLISYLNEIIAQSEELGVKALRLLGSEELRRLSRLVKASRALNPCQDYIEAVKQVTDLTRTALGAERGLFLVDRGDENLSVEVASGSVAIEKRGLRFSTTVAQKVSESGKPLLSLDAQTDRALGTTPSIKILGTVSVMCVPLGTKDHCLGYLYVDNSVKRGAFKDADLALATIIADLAAASLEKNRHHQLALQAQSVSSAKFLVSSLSRDLLPVIQTLEQIGKRLPTDDTTCQYMKQKTEQCLTVMEKLLPQHSKSRSHQSGIDLTEVFEKIFSGTASELEFPLPPPGGWPQLQGDFNEFSTVFSGLLKAARKAATDKIRLLVAKDRKHVKITIWNTSASMNSRELESLFHPSQLHGLSHVQRLVHENKGLLRAQRDPVGGTLFTVEFPI